ncbi:n-acetyltransferase domain-containing protein [Nephila pilipes]|uniref:N-acetyltransferase domain-containing protein n=1 Tax=Nephila pilipes TaxID=299642 RepID=A0A8X6TK64_NEPPI|nr:n-acetyltransferase domain-containing protein [Nephila pilipes]
MPVRSCKVVKRSGENGDAFFYVRSLRQEDVPQFMELRRELGIHDVGSCLQTWLTVDPQGVKVMETDSGELVGACGFLRNTDDLAFLGFYCIRSKFQGYGLGMDVYKDAVEHAGNANGALNAVPGKLELYRDKGGFPIVETEFKCVKNYTTDPVDPRNLSSVVPKGVSIEAVQDYHLPAMFDYDYSLVGFERKLALALNCQEKNSRTFVAMKNGACVGFGTIKTTCLGAGRVGPLYADDPAVAEVLLKMLVISLPNVKGLVMNTVSNNITAKKFLKKLGVPVKEELTRMYTKKKIDVDTKKVFALFDLNLTPF